MERSDNKHTGSTFDSFLEAEGLEPDTKVSGLVEHLIKSGKCVRCGKPNMSGTKGGRCKACMDKLTAKRHKPGTKERAWNKADGAQRREGPGGNGTSHAKSKGRMKDRKGFIKRFQNNEKAAGAKLSPDRKQNDTGYTSSNVRNVPEKLNRGRHHVDPKKLKAWKKRLKKSDIDLELLYTALLAKAANDTATLTLLQSLEESGLSSYIDANEELEKSLKHSDILPYDNMVHFDVNNTLATKTKEKQDDSVDIDGTWHSPITKNIELLKKLKSEGKHIAVWSKDGHRYAELAVKALKLANYVDAVLSKPDGYVDDKDASKWMGEHHE